MPALLHVIPSVLTMHAALIPCLLMLQTLMPMERDAEDSGEDDHIGMSWGLFSDHISLKMAAAKVPTDMPTLPMLAACIC